MKFATIFIAIACLASSKIALADDQQPVYDHKPEVHRIDTDLQNPDRLRLAQRADLAIGGIVGRIAGALDDHGYGADASAIRQEWAGKFQGYLPTIIRQGYLEGRAQDVPELYTPMSLWLRDWYHRTLDLLGPTVCQALHIDDIQILNEGTPVVLRIQSVIGPVVPSSQVYEAYFDQWCGVVAYWSVFVGCEAVFWGSDITLICTPAAMIAERVVLKRIAPRWSDRVWARLYQ